LVRRLATARRRARVSNQRGRRDRRADGRNHRRIEAVEVDRDVDLPRGEGVGDLLGPLGEAADDLVAR